MVVIKKGEWDNVSHHGACIGQRSARLLWVLSTVHMSRKKNPALHIMKDSRLEDNESAKKSWATLALHQPNTHFQSSAAAKSLVETSGEQLRTVEVEQVLGCGIKQDLGPNM